MKMHNETKGHLTGSVLLQIGIGWRCVLIISLFVNCAVLGEHEHPEQEEMSPKSVLLFLAEGAEEMEVVITVDVLRRAKVDVTIAGVPTGGSKKCGQNTLITPDTDISSVSGVSYDAVVIPGGAKGAETLAKDATVGAILKRHLDEGKVIGAICAGPTVLKEHGIGAPGTKVTSYPSFQQQMELGGYSYSEERVVLDADSNIITSRAPGTAFEFAFALVERVLDRESVEKVMTPMLYQTD